MFLQHKLSILKYIINTKMIKDEYLILSIKEEEGISIK